MSLTRDLWPRNPAPWPESMPVVRIICLSGRCLIDVMPLNQGVAERITACYYAGVRLERLQRKTDR